MELHWNISNGSNYVINFASENNIKHIITFDTLGVSGHINHESTYAVVLEALKSLPEDTCLYTLETIPLWRKLIGPIGIIFALLKEGDYIINININPLRSYNYMSFHKSQFVWYRRLFSLFSVYCYVNKLCKF